MKKNWNIFLATVFVLISIAVIIVGSYYKTSKLDTYQYNQYNKIATSLTNKFDVLIEEKKKATLTIGLALAQNASFKTILNKQKQSQKLLSNFSNILRSETDFKNVWIQLVDNKGIVLSRSWTDKVGDRVYDVKSINSLKKIKNLIHVDAYDLSFKASVPIYDTQNNFIAVLETITHFNSIAKKIKEEGFEPLILVDKSYKNQLQYPFTKNFIKDYYVANKNVDRELLDYISSLDIEQEIDYKTHYSLDTKNKYMKVYYTLLSENKKPMAYVLMYKKIKHIDTDIMKSENFIINIFMTFSIVIIGFLFLLLRDKEKDDLQNTNKYIRYFLVFFMIFALVALVYFLLLSSYQKSERNNYLQSYNTNIKKDYQIIHKKFQAIAESMFETTLNNQTVSKLVKSAYTQDKDSAREGLFYLLKDRYDFFKRYDLRQLHFHLKNNESFLRFHRPQKYGDDLTNIRATVEWVNANHTRISGFEEGRIYNGFRYVFPLSYYNEFDEKEHIGSVETSFSAHAIAHEFSYSHDARVGFIIHKNIVDTKVFKSEHSNYEQSQLPNFYYEKAIKKQFEYAFEHFDIEKLSARDLQLADAKILQGEVFTVTSQDNNTLFSFIPLKNPVSGKTVASIILQIDNQILKKQNEFFTLLFSIGIILIILIFIFVFREYTLKIKFLDLSVKSQHILDSQSSIVIITNGKRILDVNKKFLSFFGYETLEAFKKDYECICEHFIEDENYFHLGKIADDTIWVNFLETISEKDRVVLILDKSSGREHSFGISYSHYKHEHYIVTFTDISGTMQEQFMLERKVVQDILTDAYNREFFDKNIEHIITKSKQKGRFLGLIFFDIDHFKNINDVYGHNIGDYALKELSRRVLDSIRDDDYLIRWGGEEFIVLITTKSLDEATSVAEHLRSMIEHHIFEDIKKITCSFGVTLHIDDKEVIETIQRADKAMYDSKHNGRNKVTAV